MNLRRHAVWIVIFSLASAGLRAGEVMVFAAASLTDALKEIAQGYSKDTVRFNFGASSLLARQIEEGAPADIFFSADEAKMDLLGKKGLIVQESRRARLSNSLVVVTAGTPLASPQDLLKLKRVALADPRIVPAGVYAREWLERLGLWKELESKVIPTQNVRAALAAVEAGNVDAAIVYKTDARIAKHSKIAYEVPAAEGPAISFPVALIKGTRPPDAARGFLAYLNGPEAGTVFLKHGFLLAP